MKFIKNKKSSLYKSLNKNLLIKRGEIIMYEKYKMRNMTWQEFAKKKDDVIILPIGATE